MLKNIYIISQLMLMFFLIHLLRECVLADCNLNLHGLARLLSCNNSYSISVMYVDGGLDVPSSTSYQQSWYFFSRISFAFSFCGGGSLKKKNFFGGYGLFSGLCCGRDTVI